MHHEKKKKINSNLIICRKFKGSEATDRLITIYPKTNSIKVTSFVLVFKYMLGKKMKVNHRSMSAGFSHYGLPGTADFGQ